MLRPDQRKVTVCSACLTAACWYREFPCDNGYSAGLVDLPVGELRKLNREHPHYWSAKKLADVYGAGSEQHLAALVAEGGGQ